MTWESINAALRQLEAEALSGAPLGSLDSIISRLRQSAGVVALNQSTVKPITFVAKLKPTGPGHP
ncbi:MAG: hypothetical protein MUO99_06290 [Dehalococcoidales bacterium]|nr:hypothetical protein [Dehalococcoidales bacterium]